MGLFSTLDRVNNLLNYGAKVIFRKTSRISKRYRVLSKILKSTKNFEYNQNSCSISVNYEVNEIHYTIFLKDYSSDLYVFDQVFLKKEYFPVISLISNLGINVNNIIDAGANIGLTSIYFNSFFKSASIIALEPNKANFKRLCKNIYENNISKITTESRGLWGFSGQAVSKTNFRDGLEWSFSLENSQEQINSSEMFNVVSIPDLMKEHNISYVDILKIDVEGGESSIFSNPKKLDWLKKVKILVIEIHEEVVSKNDIKNILANYDFIVFDSKELTIGFKNLDFLPRKDLI